MVSSNGKGLVGRILKGCQVIIKARPNIQGNFNIIITTRAPFCLPGDKGLLSKLPAQWPTQLIRAPKGFLGPGPLSHFFLKIA